ncbi:MAG: YdcF family protein [Butyrivibrio sp.]
MVLVVIFGLLALVSLVYYIIIVSYAGTSSSFATVWLMAAVVFVVLAVLIGIIRKKHIIIPVWIKSVFLALIGIGLALFLVVEGFIVSAMNTVPVDKLDYIIVLGAQVKGTRPSNSLKKRLLKAAEYLNDNPDTIAVVSGGQGTGEDISEAQCMYDFLIGEGIEADRIIMEDASVNTRENIIFSMDIIYDNYSDGEPKVGLVTNNFHIFRATSICSKLGYEVSGIAAGSDKILFVNYMVREFFAVVKYKISGGI